MSTPQSSLTLLDNTILSNFARIDKAELVREICPTCATTLEAWEEFQSGISIGKLPTSSWIGLPLVDLTKHEYELANHLSSTLGAGERTCIAVAKNRNCLFATDDRKARQIASEFGVKVTGTLGILVISVEGGKISLEEGNRLLGELIQTGYRSPLYDLSSLLS